MEEAPPIRSVAPRYREVLVKYLRPQGLRVAVLSVLLLSSITLQIVNPQVLRAFIDAIASTATGEQSIPLAWLAALFLVLALVQQGLQVAATYMGEHVAWTATNSLRTDLALHCLRLDLSFHKSRTPGELIERIDGDVTSMANFFSQFVIQIVGNVILLMGVMVVMWTIEWRVGLAVTIFTAVVLAVMLKLRTLVVPYWRAARQASAELFGFLEERLAGTVDIRANGAQEYTMRRLYTHTRERYRTGRIARLMSSIPWGVPEIAYGLGEALSLLLAAWLFASGAITLGTAFVIYFYMQFIFQPLSHISHQIDDLQKASAGMVRVQELMSTESLLKDGHERIAGAARFPSGPLSVEFKDVAFGYEGEAAVVREMTFRIEPGEVLGLLGRTGSGKTTLARLLLRLYDPAQGSCLLGGVDLRQARLQDLRDHIGMVTQEVQLFRATVRDNITFFDKTMSDERIMEALDELGLAEWSRGLPDGLDTMLGAGGSGLSAGEAQLLAFTRVFLKDPGLIILDEASSRLDPVTERLIERAVGRLLQNRTGVIIAHRLSTVDRADTIMILEQGDIVEYGPRAELATDPDSRFSQLLRTGAAEVLV
jgi:ATP-binding cassette subfamily B protein